MPKARFTVKFDKKELRVHVTDNYYGRTMVSGRVTYDRFVFNSEDRLPFAIDGTQFVWRGVEQFDRDLSRFGSVYVKGSVVANL